MDENPRLAEGKGKKGFETTSRSRTSSNKASICLARHPLVFANAIIDAPHAEAVQKFQKVLVVSDDNELKILLLGSLSPRDAGERGVGRKGLRMFKTG
jgi:hypothetical protein